jgi:ribosome-binding ATPase YchF (GTP1/OBG family)
VRCFASDEIIHVEGGYNPIRDIEIIRTELALKDLDTVEKRLASIDKDIRAGDKSAKENREILEKIREKLSRSEYTHEFADEPIVREIQLLTSKPQLYLLNGAESDISEDLKKFLQNESWLQADLSSPASLDALIQKAYEVLGLISFFTTGEDETRAWTIVRGAKAPQAAGEIHTDFEKKFIRAEVIATEKLLEAGGWNEAKKKGWLRLEGKEYVFQDGDVSVIRHG